MRRRFWLGIAAVILVALGSVLGAFLVYDDDRDDIDRMQQEEAVRAAHQAEAVAAVSVGKLATAAAFAHTQRDVDQHEFEAIGQTLVGGGALDGAAYIPRIPAAQRDDYERRLNLEIHERGLGFAMRPARPRREYFPVTFGTTDVQAERLQGFDLGSDPLRARVMRRAADSGQATATPLVRLLIGGTGINVFRPVYRDGAQLQSRAERRRALTGFIAGSFRVDNVAAAALTALPKEVEVGLRIDGRPAYGSDDLDDPASVPLRIADRTWVLAVENPNGPGLSLPIALAILGISLAALLGALIVTWSRRERMQELERQASEDALTGLDNRRRFEQDLTRAMARSQRDRNTGALLIIDIDDFKRVNDSQGHPAGDRLIQEVAGVLRRRTRRSDNLARLGGDEFAVILPRCSRQEAQIAAEAIAREVREYRSNQDGDEPVTVSVGVAMFGDDPRTSAATVFSEADTAMYAAKDEGRDGVRVFDPVAVREDVPER